MVTVNRRCSECNSEMLLDKISRKDGVETFFYACVNPECKECGIAYSPTGEETESTIKERE